MTNWESKFLRHAVERWVFQGSDPHDFTPRAMVIALGEDFLSPMLDKHSHFGVFYTGYIGNSFIGYIRVPPGSVILEGVMRSLEFTRVETVIGMGSCGALQEDIECGDIVIAESSQAGDCLSRHYGFNDGDKIPADPGLTNSMTGFLGNRGLRVHQGPIVTTGAVFRETDELISSWSREGLLGVELEAASQFALAHYMGLKSAMALLVTDSPIRNQVSDTLRGAVRQRFVKGVMDFIASA